MSGADRLRLAAGTLACVAALTAAPAVRAQTGEVGGSFEAGSFTGAAPVRPEAEAAPADSFGGSFEAGSFGDTAGAPDPAPAAAPVPPPDDFGGSFGDAAAAAGPEAEGQAAAPPAAPAPGGSDFGAGSFEPDTAAPAAPPAEPEVVAPTPPDVAAPPAEPAIRIPPQILAFETRDFDVPPTGQLRHGQLHAPTPTSVPGASVVSTEGLANALAADRPVLLIDVLGAAYSLPGAYVATPMAAPGSFSDRTQQQVATWLAQITGGDNGVPIVIYCSDPMCWLSYNAVLRAVAAGYGNVYWYRGGLQSWQMAGLRVVPAGF